MIVLLYGKLMIPKNHQVISAAIMIVNLAGFVSAMARTASTRYGRLAHESQPYEGDADLVFELFAAPGGVSPIESVILNAMPAVDGVVTVPFDSRSSPSNPIACTGLEATDNAMVLDPSRSLTPAPFSLGLFS